MQYRSFGNTGFQASEIGFGSWSIGGMWGACDDAKATESLNLALDLGINFFDTAYVYGDGHSEALIGNVVRKRKVRDKVFIATKVPPKDHEWPASHRSKAEDIFPASWIRSLTEKSLKNLQTETVDLQQLHVWSHTWQGHGDWLEELQKLKKEGKIRWVGISINDHEPDTALKIVRSGVIDSVQVIHNIFDQSPEAKLFPLCQEKKVAVIVRVPFDEGGLTGKLTPNTVFPKGDWRKYYFKGDRLRETCERANRLKSLLTDDMPALPELALKYVLSFPAVSTVIPGMRKPEHVRANAAASEGKPLPDEILEGLKKHAWLRNYYSD